MYKMDPINDNDKLMNFALGMNDDNRAQKNRLYKAHINLNCLQVSK